MAADSKTVRWKPANEERSSTPSLAAKVIAPELEGKKAEFVLDVGLNIEHVANIDFDARR